MSDVEPVQRPRSSVAAFVVACGLSAFVFTVHETHAQDITCPSTPVRGEAPVELGIAASEREDWAAAARYFEQSKACIEQNRPNVRDSTNALAAFRTANAYLQARDMDNTLRVANEALAWHVSYVNRLTPGAERADQFGMLIFFHGARALALMSSQRADSARTTLAEARMLLARNPSEQPESALIVLAMSATLAEDRYDAYVVIQRDLIRRLRHLGADYRTELRQELANHARVARVHGDSVAAQALEAEARGLR